jgi:hypothetical protein
MIESAISGAGKGEGFLKQSGFFDRKVYITNRVCEVLDSTKEEDNKIRKQFDDTMIEFVD